MSQFAAPTPQSQTSARQDFCPSYGFLDNPDWHGKVTLLQADAK